MRSYQQSHPWISFSATDIDDLDPKTWMLLGEARSKCEHLSGVPLHSDAARRLYEVAMVKGAQATTAIEGNTLTQEQVAGILDGTFSAPASREYQEREVRNVLDALTEIADQVTAGEAPAITKALICDFNRRLLHGTDHEPDAAPGRIREHQVVVARYRGAPAEDCGYLLERLAEWLESDTFKSEDPEIAFALVVVCAIYAHIYIAWLHPFGDGNGRTARLLEFLILARSARVPFPAAHSLPNHYNLTRDRYYRELARSSRTNKTSKFLTYATQGFVDEIRSQIEEVRAEQLEVAWINYVHETMGQFPASQARERQRALVLAMPADEAFSKRELAVLPPNVAAMYARSGPRTLSRDVNRLRDAGLILELQGPKRWIANRFAVRAFLPPGADARR